MRRYVPVWARIVRAALETSVAIAIGAGVGACGSDADPVGANPPTAGSDYSGALVDPNGDPPGVPIRLVFQSGSRADTVISGANGRFAGAAGGAVAASVRVEVTDASGRFHPSLFEVSRERLAGQLGVILVPKRRALDTPHYDVTVALDLEAAFTYPGRDTGLYSWWRLLGARQPGGTVGWPAARFPIPVHVLPDGMVPFRGSSDADTVWLRQVRITGDQEQTFWASIDAMEERFGWDLFRPATPADLADTIRSFALNGQVLHSFHPYTVSVSVVDSLSEKLRVSAAGSSVPWSEEAQASCAPNTYCFGTVLITSSAIGGRRTVAHELMHVLGFGHACLPSVMYKFQCEREGIPFADLPTAVAPSPSGAYQRATEYDVAFAELLFAMHATRVATGFEFGLWEAYQGLRVLEQGLEPVERCWEEDVDCG